MTPYSGSCNKKPMIRTLHILDSPWSSSVYPLIMKQGAAARGRSLYYLRLIVALALIAGEFTNLVPYLSFVAASNANTAHLALHIPAYDLEYLSYVVCLLIVLSDPRSLKALIDKPVFIWVFVAVIVFTWGMLIRVMNTPTGYYGYLLMRPFGLRLNALAFMLSCTMIFADRGVLAATKRGVVWATLLAVALNCYEVFYPGVFSLDPGRAAGLYGDPNGSGIAIVFGTLIGLSVVSKRWRELFVLAAGVGVVATFSRQAMLALLILVLVCAFARVICIWKVVLAGTLACVAFVSLNLGTTLTSSGVLDANNVARLRMTLSGTSATERVEVARMMWDRFAAAPLLGNGFNTAGFWTHRQSHDLYLSFMADHGILGVLLLPALALSLFRRHWHYYAFASVLLLWQLFDHELFMYAFALIVLGIEANESAWPAAPDSRRAM